jgi:hypothetical protein
MNVLRSFAMKNSAWFQLSHLLVGLALTMWSESALAHGESYLILAAGLLGLGVGAIFGVVAGLRRKGRFPTLGHAISIFLCVGMLAGIVTTRSGGGAALFLVFGGIGGILPLAAGYQSLRLLLKWSRRSKDERFPERE